MRLSRHTPRFESRANARQLFARGSELIALGQHLGHLDQQACVALGTRATRNGALLKKRGGDLNYVLGGVDLKLCIAKTVHSGAILTSKLA